MRGLVRVANASRPWALGAVEDTVECVLLPLLSAVSSSTGRSVLDGIIPLVVFASVPSCLLICQHLSQLHRGALKRLKKRVSQVAVSICFCVWELGLLPASLVRGMGEGG